jgi:hypothetical protein
LLQRKLPKLGHEILGLVAGHDAADFHRLGDVSHHLELEAVVERDDGEKLPCGSAFDLVTVEELKLAFARCSRHFVLPLQNATTSSADISNRDPSTTKFWRGSINM